MASACDVVLMLSSLKDSIVVEPLGSSGKVGATLALLRKKKTTQVTTQNPQLRAWVKKILFGGTVLRDIENRLKEYNLESHLTAEEGVVAAARFEGETTNAASLLTSLVALLLAGVALVISLSSVPLANLGTKWLIVVVIFVVVVAAAVLNFLALRVAGQSVAVDAVVQYRVNRGSLKVIHDDKTVGVTAE